MILGRRFPGITVSNIFVDLVLGVLLLKEDVVFAAISSLVKNLPF